MGFALGCSLGGWLFGSAGGWYGGWFDATGFWPSRRDHGTNNIWQLLLMVRRRGFGCWVRDGNYILRFCGVMCHVLGLQPALNHKFHLVATFMWD